MKYIYYICTTTRLIATKSAKFVTYYEKLPPIESHNPFYTWSCEVTWQIKISPLLQCIWPSNLAGGYIRWGAFFHEITRPFPWSLSPARSRDKSNILFPGSHLGSECKFHFLQMLCFERQVTIWAWSAQPTRLSELPLQLGSRRSQSTVEHLQ